MSLSRNQRFADGSIYACFLYFATPSVYRLPPTESCDTIAEKFSTVRRLTDSQPSSSYAMTSTFLMDAAFAAPAPPMATI